MLRDVFAASAELKFVGDPAEGVIEGYGSVYNVLDYHQDLIEPGAFDATLAEQKASGRKMPMFAEHSFALFGGDPHPVGVWDEVTPDERGLHVKGHFVALKHPDVQRAYELSKEGLMGGISIAYKVGDFVKGTKAGEPARRIKSIGYLHSIDLVSEPANSHARVTTVKSMMTMPHTQSAADSIKQAHQMCLDCMGGGDAPTKSERDQIMTKLRQAHRDLTGEDLPMEGKSFEPTIREFEDWLREKHGFSRSKARDIGNLVFKSANPRDEDDAAAKEAVRELRAAFGGFSLPKIGD